MKHEFDATGKAPGRLATQVVGLLMGKGKPDYAPQADTGDFVVVHHASLMKFTGKKMEQKKYFRHTTYGSGLRETPVKRVWSEDPSEVLRRAVSRMLPKNSLRTERLKRLEVKN